jgi:hypothetical protein
MPKTAGHKRTLVVAVRTAFNAAAALWRPWSRKRVKQEAPTRQQQSNARSKQVPQSLNSDQGATAEKRPNPPTKRAQSPKPLAPGETVNKKPKATKRAQPPKPLEQEATVEKKPKAPTKRSLKQEQELEREELAQKTERLRQLRLAKEAADRNKDQP